MEIDLNFGTWGGVDEANFSTATAWFPYEQEWIGGWMGDPDASGLADWAGGASFSPQLGAVDPNDIMAWTDTFEADEDIFIEGGGDFGAVGKFSLSELGVHSLNDGMLFTNSADGSSSTNITSAAPLADGSGWQFTAREDSQELNDTVAARDQASFSFVYVPYDANGLVGGHINGDDASTIGGAGDFNVARSAAGSYGIQIDGKTDEDGVLMLSNADFLGDSAILADNNHLSYAWNSETSTFEVEARHFDGEVNLEDTDFYFMWVDFESPLTLEDGLACNRDTMGDLDGSGDVGFPDFLILSANFGQAATDHTTGDIDCSGDVGFPDFLVLSANFGQTVGGAQSVPEPSALALLGLGGLFVGLMRRRRS